MVARRRVLPREKDAPQRRAVIEQIVRRSSQHVLIDLQIPFRVLSAAIRAARLITSRR
jgi:hypothetical protein